jgi:hypothetical protein
MFVVAVKYLSVTLIAFDNRKTQFVSTIGAEALVIPLLQFDGKAFAESVYAFAPQTRNDFPFGQTGCTSGY